MQPSVANLALAWRAPLAGGRGRSRGGDELGSGKLSRAKWLIPSLKNCSQHSYALRPWRQVDEHFPELTVRETLEFSAACQAMPERDEGGGALRWGRAPALAGRSELLAAHWQPLRHAPALPAEAI